jgi:hypothetical protein
MLAASSRALNKLGEHRSPLGTPPARGIIHCPRPRVLFQLALAPSVDALNVPALTAIGAGPKRARSCVGSVQPQGRQHLCVRSAPAARMPGSNRITPLTRQQHALSYACHARDGDPVPYSDPHGRPRLRVPFRRMPAAARRCTRPRLGALKLPAAPRWRAAQAPGQRHPSAAARPVCQAKGCGRAAPRAAAPPARAPAAGRAPGAAPAARPALPAPAAPPARRCAASGPAAAAPLDAGASSSLRCGVLSTTLATCGRTMAPVRTAAAGCPPQAAAA